MSTQKIKFHVDGMHCKACVLLTESQAEELPFVSKAVSNLSDHTICVEGDFEGRTNEDVADALTDVMKDHGYTVTIEKKNNKKNWNEFTMAGPIAFGFIILFAFLQKTNLIHLVGKGGVTYGTAFLVGVVASLSSCMAVVGGLLLSMSATFAKEGDKIKPQLLFHLGRIVSFFVLGGVIGFLGSAFTVNANVTLMLGLVVSLVMLILGINLLDVFSWAKKFQPSMPKFIAKRAHAVSNLNHTLTPFAVGIATFFLPCGFTQSMQLYALSTGSFIVSAFLMFSFSLGTLPVLSLVSFSSFSVKNKKYSGVFFKTAGLIVIVFAIFNIINSLAAVGIISPVFNF